MTTPDWAEPVVARRLPAAAVTVAVLALVVWRIGPAPYLPAFCYLAVVGVALAFIDVELKRLPDALTLPSYAAATLLLGLAAPFTRHGGARFVHALIGLAALFLLYAVQWFFMPGQIGLGDVKVAGVVGLYLGWLGLPAWVAGVCAGSCARGAVLTGAPGEPPGHAEVEHSVRPVHARGRAGRDARLRVKSG